MLRRGLAYVYAINKRCKQQNLNEKQASKFIYVKHKSNFKAKKFERDSITEQEMLMLTLLTCC